MGTNSRSVAANARRCKGAVNSTLAKSGRKDGVQFYSSIQRHGGEYTSNEADTVRQLSRSGVIARDVHENIKSARQFERLRDEDVRRFVQVSKQVEGAKTFATLTRERFTVTENSVPDRTSQRSADEVTRMEQDESRREDANVGARRADDEERPIKRRRREGVLQRLQIL
jgi:hypothetical protein